MKGANTSAWHPEVLYTGLMSQYWQLHWWVCYWLSSILRSCDWWLMCTDIWADIKTMTSSSDDEQMNKKIDEQWRGWAAEVNKLRLTRDSWAAVGKWSRSWWAADQQQQRWAVLDNLAVLKSRCVAAVLMKVISSIDQQQIEETSDEVM